MRKGAEQSLEQVVLALLCAALVHCGGNAAKQSESRSPAPPVKSDAGGSEDGGDGGSPSTSNGDPTPSTGTTTSTTGANPGSAGCNAVPVTGRCKDSSTVELCIAPSGGTIPPHISSYECRPGEMCMDTKDGARCELVGECVVDATACVDSNTLKTCVLGRWNNSTCSKGCVTNALGAACAPDVVTKTLTGKLSYEARLPRDDYTEYRASATTLPAPHVLAISYDGNTTVDAVYTGENGAFSIKVPQTATSDDVLTFALVAADTEGTPLYAVAAPGFPARTKARSTFDPPPDPAVWAWSFALASVAEGDGLLVPETSGSGALHLYRRLTSVYEGARAFYKETSPESVVVWMGLGTGWDCGACMATLRTELAGATFDHQLWLDGSSDQGYWSDAVTAHELGHYVMSAYSYEPAEGGPHFIGVPTNPGQAWSEGFATFFSSMERASYIYFDKQGGGFFWLDLKERLYGIANTPWQRPSATGGLTQLIDENEVAALLRGVYDAIGNNAPILNAIKSARMTKPPFERGYKLRTWTEPENPGMFTETSESLPYLADLLDTLLCSGALTPTQLDGVTLPAKHYPYPSASPLCR